MTTLPRPLFCKKKSTQVQFFSRERISKLPGGCHYSWVVRVRCLEKKLLDFDYLTIIESWRTLFNLEFNLELKDMKEFVDL